MRKALIKLLQELRLLSTVRKIRDRVTSVESNDPLWQQQMARFYSQFINEGDLCFDIGANIGKMTWIFLALGARVVCVEPQKECLRILSRAFRKNPNVTIVGDAVGECKGRGVLAVCEQADTISTMSKEWRQNSRFSKDYKWRKTQTVTVITLDTLVQHYGLPKFCKIDVEGFEESVLKGLTKPIPFVSFEFTQEHASKTKNCINRLSSIGYEEFNCTSGDTGQFLFSRWLRFEEMSQEIDAVADKASWGNIYAKLGPWT